MKIKNNKMFISQLSHRVLTLYAAIVYIQKIRVTDKDVIISKILWEYIVVALIIMGIYIVVGVIEVFIREE